MLWAMVQVVRGPGRNEILYFVLSQRRSALTWDMFSHLICSERTGSINADIQTVSSNSTILLFLLLLQYHARGTVSCCNSVTQDTVLHCRTSLSEDPNPSGSVRTQKLIFFWNIDEYTACKPQKIKTKIIFSNVRLTHALVCRLLLSH